MLSPVTEEAAKSDTLQVQGETEPRLTLGVQPALGFGAVFRQPNQPSSPGGRGAQGKA